MFGKNYLAYLLIYYLLGNIWALNQSTTSKACINYTTSALDFILGLYLLAMRSQ